MGAKLPCVYSINNSKHGNLFSPYQAIPVLISHPEMYTL